VESKGFFPHDAGDGTVIFEGGALSDRQPWSVRGVDREARDKAARAAHERHMTIGEWLSEAVIKTANHDLGIVSAENNTNLPAKQDRTPELANALGSLVTHLEKSGGGGSELATRIDRTEAVLTGRMEQIAAAMYGVMQTVEKNSARTVEHDPRQQAIAEEQARIAEQIAMMSSAEERRQEQMVAIAEALTMLATKVDTAPVQPAAAPVSEPLPQPVAEPEPQPAPVVPDVAGHAGPVAETSAPSTWPDDDEEPLTVGLEPLDPEPEPQLRVEPRLERDAPAGTDSFRYANDTVRPHQTAEPQAMPRHHDPRAEEVARQIREAATAPPSMPDDNDDEPRRPGLLGRLFNRD
jgi:hypothetical protein